MVNIRENIEIFHLLFLDQLGRKIDKQLYALKGGCNLRFYFQSIRYSEDLDLDVKKIRKDTLYKNVQSILENKSFEHILQTRGISLKNISAPKQTDLTQRWKIALNVAVASERVEHTKIEFSRRTMQKGIVFSAIDGVLSGYYQLPPILLSHYDRNTAIIQKITALAERSITQARDIFDLYWLLLANPVLPKNLFLATNQHQTKALTNLQSISFSDFRSQVVAFLAPEYQKQYADAAIWQQITAVVKKALAEKVKCN